MLKADSGTDVFLWILRNFWEYIFYTTPLVWLVLEWHIVVIQRRISGHVKHLWRNFFAKIINGFYRSSRPEVFCKKGVLKRFIKFTGKHLWNAWGMQLYKKWVSGTGAFLEFCEIAKKRFLQNTYENTLARYRSSLAYWSYNVKNKFYKIFTTS